MQLTPQEITNRLKLWEFIRCLAYLYHQKLDASVKTIVMSKETATVQQLMPKIAYKFDISTRDLYTVWKGDDIPKRHVLNIFNQLVSDKPMLVRYIQASAYAYGIVLDDKFKRVLNGKDTKDVTEKYLNHKAIALRTPQRIFSHTFQRVGYTFLYNDSLIHYLTALLYYDNKSFNWLAQSLGYGYPSLRSKLLRKSESIVLGAIQQVPNILHISKGIPKAVLEGDRHPQEALLAKANSSVHDRQSLDRYVNIFSILDGTTLSQLSAYLGRSSSYIRWAILHDEGEVIADTLYKVAQIECVPSSILLSALARANVESAEHAYRVHMRFITRYYSSPIKYREEDEARKNDILNAKSHEASIKACLNSDQGLRNLDLEHHIYLLIVNWGKLYGFNGKKFIKENFKNLDDFDNITSVFQNHKATPILKHDDWTQILHKIKYQLDTVRNAFSVPELQKSKLSPCLYVNGYNLKTPYSKHAMMGLKPFADKGRFLFRGQFSRTGVKIVPQGNDVSKEIYHPMIYLTHVVHGHSPVASEIRLNYGSGLTKLGQLQERDLLSFTARVRSYLVGRPTRDTVAHIKFKVVYPSNIKIVRKYHARDVVKVPTNPMALTGFAIEADRMSGYDFTERNYQYARYCINRYRKWKRQQEIKD